MIMAASASSSLPATPCSVPKYNLDELVLHDWFIAQAKKTPDAIALVDGESKVELTFQQLNDITDLLAIQLVEVYNVRPDSVVGILLPRSAQYVIANVAILKAGGAYMPLELVYPKPLLERAIQETESNVVFTNSLYVNRVQEQTHIVMLDEYPFVKPYENPNGHSYPPPMYVHPKPDDLAFCVMSSGTTGAPKGILQTHRAAVYSYLDRRTRFPYHTTDNGNIDDRIGAGVFFVWELFRPLAFGGTCVTIPDKVLYDPHAVTKFVKDYNITRFLVTPSLMQLILDSLTPAEVQHRMAHIRVLWFCGEVVSRDLALASAKVLPSTELLNLYSISECHDVSIGDLKRELDLSRKYATCGKAIPGVKFYIVDLEDNAGDSPVSTMKLVPDGETGEVYVGGPVVGRGYINLPEKTAEKFVPNIFDDDPTCARLYKTGDLGRVLPSADSDGTQQLEVLGRCDFMVKIRGYSVVLGAVETALAKHPKLLSSVVLAIGSEGSSDKKLVAYVVPAEWKDPPSASSVRTFLKDHLPPYAIPSTFCVIDALPVSMTSAGKVDRKQLPKPETATRLRAFSEDLTAATTTVAQQKTSRLAPQSHTEQAILKLWCDLLDLPPEDLSALDSFFEVGGHSLLATKLVNVVNQHFGRTTENGLSILSVVEGPTIREMAEFLSTTTGSVDGSKVQIDLQVEAASLDPSIYPFPTRKGNTMSRFRIESSVLLRPRVIFLTGGTGYLGAHILANLLQTPGLTTVCLARAKSDEAAKERLLQTLEKYQLLLPTLEALDEADPENTVVRENTCDKKGRESILDSRLIAIAGDLSKPLLGLADLQFKSLALEVDSIIHCGAEVNLIKPYMSLKESNVLGTQEVLRLATTNGFVKTKVKPVHYISTNGIFPVDPEAYHRDSSSSEIIHLKEDFDLANYAPFLSEGYAMSKWVAERMCEVAESRGLPISVLRPGNMAGSSQTGLSNPDDLNYMLIQGILDAGCAPVLDSNFALDLTPVDFAAQAVTHLVVSSPQEVLGQRMHLQSPQKPVLLKQIVEWLNEVGHSIKAVSRKEWIECIANTDEKLASGWDSFEKYFDAYAWLEMDSTNLQQALKDTTVKCATLDANPLAKWFPKITKQSIIE
jgi:amino acid adenylation domain-containing protein/thioester reductase-like protein